MKKKRIVRQKAKGPVDPALGEKVRELRLAKGMTQAELAGDDFSKGFISLVETGRTRISLRAAGIFASRLGIEVAELVGAESMPPIEGFSDLSARLLAISRRSREPVTIITLQKLADESEVLSQLPVIQAVAVHSRVLKAIAILSELAEATAPKKGAIPTDPRSRES